MGPAEPLGPTDRYRVTAGSRRARASSGFASRLIGTLRTIRSAWMDLQFCRAHRRISAGQEFRACIDSRLAEVQGKNGLPNGPPGNPVKQEIVMTLALLALAAASSAGTACLFLICEPIEDLSYRDRRQEKDGDVSSPATRCFVADGVADRAGDAHGAAAYAGSGSGPGPTPRVGRRCSCRRRGGRGLRSCG